MHRCDRYQMERLLTVGGMAELYLGRERLAPGIERAVVIKRLLPQYRHDDEFITMFLDEARLCVALSHPHILQVFDVCPIDADWLIVMEYVPGASLRSVLDAAETAPLAPRYAVDLGLVLAETLHYVHSVRDAHGRPLGIVHRDLNPANVLIGGNGGIKLIDFGIALGENRVYETATGMSKGTVGYMAPEQLEPKPSADPRTDIFALGILLYEMITGSHPFATRQPLELYARIMNGHYTKMRDKRPETPIALEALVGRCLCPQRDARPADMLHVARELRSIRAQTGDPPVLGDWSALVMHSQPPQAR
jgi:serine/threonine protein kinase